MEKLFLYLIANAPNSLGKAVVGLAFPPAWRSGMDPRQAWPVLNKVAQVLRGQTPAYVNDDEKDAVEGLAELLPYGLRFYAVPLTPEQVEPIVAAIARRLSERYPPLPTTPA